MEEKAVKGLSFLRQPHNGLPVCGTCSPTQWHRVTAGSDAGMNLYHKLCLITYCRK